MKELWPILLQNVLPAVLGLIAGVIGSLFGPLVQWSVEKRRGRTERRQYLITTGRWDFQNHDFDSQWLGDTASYSALRPHLRPEIREKIEKPRTIYVSNEGRGNNVKRQMLLDEIARIDKEWGLV